MAGRNRYLKGKTNTILAPVHGYHLVEEGDFMVLSAVDYLTTLGVAADNYAAPFSALKADTSQATVVLNRLTYTYFLGVAMEGSPLGVTENITIATTGVFRYPLYDTNAPSGVTVGSLVAAVSANCVYKGVSPQTVVHGTDAVRGSTSYLGYIVKTESGASFVDFEIRTAYGPGGLES